MLTLFFFLECCLGVVANLIDLMVIINLLLSLNSLNDVICMIHYIVPLKMES